MTFIRDGRRHSIVQIAQYTIDRKMREYDCASRMYTQYSLHSIHKVSTQYTQSIHITQYTQSLHITQYGKNTIDRKMREYDCAAKTSRRMIVDTWCLDGRDIVAGETVAILTSN